MTTDTVKSWIENEMGKDYTYKPKPGTVEVAADPQVEGTFAARFVCLEDGDRTVDLLFITRDAREGSTDSEALAYSLEEVEYHAWPPRSGNLRFFVV